MHLYLATCFTSGKNWILMTHTSAQPSSHPSQWRNSLTFYYHFDKWPTQRKQQRSDIRNIWSTGAGTNEIRLNKLRRHHCEHMVESIHFIRLQRNAKWQSYEFECEHRHKCSRKSCVDCCNGRLSVTCSYNRCEKANFQHSEHVINCHSKILIWRIFDGE